MIAIHQPNFFPWLGYFDKILSVDKFVFLDDVQLVKTGGSYTNRVKCLVGGAPRWVGVPVARPALGTLNISETTFHRADWHKKFLNTIQMNYAKHHYFDSYFSEIQDICMASSDRIAEFNVNCILWAANHLGQNREKFLLSSSLGIDTTSTQRLIDITKALEGTSYLEGGGADRYQCDEMFNKNSLALVKQNFTHPVYPQRKTEEFHPGLSILDAFFNIGHQETRVLLKKMK